MKIKLLIYLLSFLLFTYGQSQNKNATILESSNLNFRDTVSNLVFDSISNNLGKIISNDEFGNNKLTKYFKYIGNDSIYITRTWTSDPHYICEYPKEILIPNKIFSINICFSHKNKLGIFNKRMGFYLSDSSIVTLNFLGEYIMKK